MSESTSKAPHQPGVYAKGESVRTATTPAAAVALVFDGYTRQADAPAESAPVDAPKSEVSKTAPVKDESPKPSAPKAPKDNQ